MKTADIEVGKLYRGKTGYGGTILLRVERVLTQKQRQEEVAETRTRGSYRRPRSYTDTIQVTRFGVVRSGEVKVFDEEGSTQEWVTPQTIEVETSLEHEERQAEAQRRRLSEASDEARRTVAYITEALEGTDLPLPRVEVGLGGRSSKVSYPSWRKADYDRLIELLGKG